MGDTLQGKRLLVLGGYPLMKSAIDKAHELGAYVIVTDWNHDAPAKRFADEAYDVSTTDVDALEALAVKCHADGVFLGYVDVNLIPGAKVCERLGLPCYASEQLFARTLDKNSFKSLCHHYGIPAVETSGSGGEVTEEQLASMSYPIIVKPADSYSSKGISVCFNPDEARFALSKAIAASGKKSVIVEPFVQGDDVYLYFTVQDGKLSLSAMADRFLHDPSGSEGFAPQPMLYMFPSKYIDEYYDQAHDALQRMVTGEGLRNGSFMMQGFMVDGRLSFFEMGLRLTGGAGYINIRHQNEIDQLEMHVRYALGDGFGPWDVERYDNPRFKRPACVLVPLLRNGVIGDVRGIEEIRAHGAFVSLNQLHFVGDDIQAAGTLNQSFARIYLCAGNDESLFDAIRFVKRMLDVTDDRGESMLLEWFDDEAVASYISGRREKCPWLYKG